MVVFGQCFLRLDVSVSPSDSLETSLILASQSPRRRQLLTDAGYDFKVVAPSDEVERGICSSCSPEDTVLEGAFLKARAIAKRCLLYTSPSPRDKRQSRMPSSA